MSEIAELIDYGDQCHTQGGWIFPKTETHLTSVMEPGKKRHAIIKGRWQYQHHKLMLALDHLPENRRRIAVDVGAHVGLMSYHMVDYFRHVHAFEPIPIHQWCYRKNMAEESGWTLHTMGLSDIADVVDFHFPTDTTGDAHVATPGKKLSHGGKEEILTIKDVYMGYLDQFDFNEVDFIKIDVEGHELSVVTGAIETLKRCKPVLLIEQKGNDERFYGQPRNAALEFLESLGARSAREYSGDHVVVWT